MADARKSKAPTSDVVEYLTLCVIIENTDDQLSQRQWAAYVSRLHRIMKMYSSKFRFNGGTDFTNESQLRCEIIKVRSDQLKYMMQELEMMGLEYDQDSISYMVGPLRRLKLPHCRPEA